MRFAVRACVVRLVVVLGPLALAGCSTLFGGRTQKLTVTSNLPGAHVYVAGADSGATPRTMRIRRGKSPLVLRVQRDSDNAVTQTLRRGVSGWGLLFNAMIGVESWFGTSFGGGPSPVFGGVVSFALFTAIDAASGMLMMLKTDSVHVTLPGPPARTELRVPANTAYLAPDADAGRVSRAGDLAPFARPGSSLIWFGSFTSAGSVQSSVSVSVPRGDTVTLSLTLSGEGRDARRVTHSAVAIGTNSEVRVPFGDFDIPAPGYSRFELAASGGAAVPAVRVSALLLDGAPVSDAHFNRDPRRNAASVHLRYPVDSSAVVTGFYNEVVATEDPVTTYYMATGFARGYFGMQVNSPTERRIIFSVWDAGAGGNAKDRSTVSAGDQTQLLGKGEGVVAEVFGNEGTGGHSHLVYDWKTGSTQRFYVTAALDGTHTIYSGYWFHPERRQWHLIASFRAPKDGQGLRRLYSFSENFGGSTGHLVRKAHFGPQWIRLGGGEWHELTTATFSHDVTGKENRLDRFMGVEAGRFFLQHGGFVPGYTASGAVFSRPATGVPPQIDLPPGRDR